MKKTKLALVVSGALASGIVVSAGLIGVSFKVGTSVPRTDMVGPAGSFNYDRISRALVLSTSQGFNSRFVLNAPLRPHASTPTANMLAINIKVLSDDGSSYTGNGVADDFKMTGTFDINGDNLIDSGETGTLLTGSLLQFGFENMAGTSDGADFRFAVTGGVWAPRYAGKDIGVREIVESSTLPDGANFSTSFTAAVKANVIPIPCIGSIGDFVWNDLNRNGLQDPGEPGLNGVTVSLTGTTLNGNLLVNPTPIVTNNNRTGGAPGFYQFTGLCLGTYIVTVNESTAVGFIPTTIGAGPDRTVDSNRNPATITLLANQLNGDQTIDFGFKSPCTGSIGDFVWHDLNRNGIQDAGEPGMQGVGIKLKGTDGSVITTTTTGANGFYQFTGLCAGTYRVEVDSSTVPAGFGPTTPGQGGTALDSNSTPYDVTLASDSAADSTVDFGYTGLCEGKVGDFVWFDANGNGLQDPLEAGIDGLTVSLTGPGGLRTTTTGVSPSDSTRHGYYQFTGLCTGTYAVSTTAPAGFTSTTSLSGPDRTTDSNTAGSSVTLTNDFASDQTIDFGFSSCAGSIGDRVWQDLNLNGVQDAGEPGFPGVIVNMRLQSDNSIIQTATTGANGGYTFNGVCPGNYKLEAVPPSGTTASPTGAGTPATDSNVNPSVVSLLTANSSDLTVDFGFRPTGSIGDRVWSDANGNGLQNSGEPGLVGWTVNITGPNGYTSSQTTGADGLYTFNYLLPGTYAVCVTPQAGYTETFDLDFPATANCAPRTIGAGEHASDVDFGDWQPASIGDRVWNDVNANGVIDGGELGLSGWTVTISGATLPGGYGATQSTGGDGFYTFSRLPAGTYKVCVTPESGYLQTYDLDGLTTPSCAMRTVAAGENATDVDFGYRLGKTFATTGSMEGNLSNILPGDWVNGGYSFKFVNGSHAATSFSISGTVSIVVRCSQGGGPGGTIIVPLNQLPFGSSVPSIAPVAGAAGPNSIVWGVPANNSDWLASGDQNNVWVWSGAVQAPDLCGGKPMDDVGQAGFTATVSQAPATGSLVDFRFHYRDPAAKGKPNTNCLNTSDPNRAKADVCGASWSGTRRDP